MGPRLLFYACGGGFGHGVRALGLARVCRAQGASVLVLAPRRLEPFACWAGVPHRAPPVEPPDRPTLRDWVLGEIQAFAPDGVVLDVFPRGVLGELTGLVEGLAPSRVLVTRHVHPGFYELPGMGDALNAFDLVLATEPPAPVLLDHPGLRRVPPITLVTGQDLSRRPEPPWSRVLDLTGPLHVLPAALSMVGAQVVVAHGGYASYYEIYQAGVPAVVCPRDRPLDDQLRRACGQFGLPLRAPFEVVSTRAEVPAALRRLAGALPAGILDPGGGTQGARLVLDLLATRSTPPLRPVALRNPESRRGDWVPAPKGAL